MPRAMTRYLIYWCLFNSIYNHQTNPHRRQCHLSNLRLQQFQGKRCKFIIDTWNSEYFALYFDEASSMTLFSSNLHLPENMSWESLRPQRRKAFFVTHTVVFLNRIERTPPISNAVSRPIFMRLPKFTFDLNIWRIHVGCVQEITSWEQKYKRKSGHSWVLAFWRSQIVLQGRDSLNRSPRFF